jgi:hypothetical protein
MSQISEEVDRPAALKAGRGTPARVLSSGNTGGNGE